MRLQELALYKPYLMRNLFLMGISAILFLFSSCTKDVLRGGGSIGTKTLNLPEFSAIESHYDIGATITYGATQQISVTGYDNLLNALDFIVVNGVLKMKFDSKYESVRNGNVMATITIPALNKATIHGSKNLVMNGFSGTSLTAGIHGSGNIKIENSQFQSMFLDIYGSGSINALSSPATRVNASIHGSGDISVEVSEKITANIYGSGNVYYVGNPVVEAVQQGSGRVIKR